MANRKRTEAKRPAKIRQKKEEVTMQSSPREKQKNSNSANSQDAQLRAHQRTKYTNKGQNRNNQPRSTHV